MTVVALVGVLVNLIATALASRADRSRLSIRGAFAHLVNDLWAFLATAVAGLIILTTGWTRADALASLVVAVLMGITGVGLLRASSRQLLEAAPPGLDPLALGAELAAVDGVAQVHDLHVWELGHLDSAVSAHVLVQPGYDCHAVGAQLRQLLDARHGLHHATLQLDHDQSESPTELASADAHCEDAHGPVHSARG
jgi:cobalt-zinc-cadmium efflux system protein